MVDCVVVIQDLERTRIYRIHSPARLAKLLRGATNRLTMGDMAQIADASVQQAFAAGRSYAWGTTR